MCWCVQVVTFVQKVVLPCVGLDTGVMLFRNSDWSRTFVDDALAFLDNEAKQVSRKPCLALLPVSLCVHAGRGVRSLQ
jgi:hypothetical protein